MGIFRSALLIRRSFQENIHLQSSTTTDSPSSTAGSTSAAGAFPSISKAMRYLQILCPEEDQTPQHSPLKSTIIQHYHAIGILLGLSLGELFCWCGFRVSSEEVTRCRHRLRVWIQRHGSQAREVVRHAGLLFGCIRRSDMRAYHEGRAFMIACQTLWVYGELFEPPSAEQTSSPTVRLDQRLSSQDEQSWITDGARIRPYLAGVGCMLGAAGVNRLIQEGSRVLCKTRTWGFSNVMGKALKLWHQFQSESNLA